MIFIDLIEGKPAIDWQRFDTDRARNHHTSHKYVFTHQAIASLDGSPDEKLQQLEKIIINESFLYRFAVKNDKYCCRVEWFEKKGFGVATSESEAKTLAQIDLLSILCEQPYDHMGEAKRSKNWSKYSSGDA